MVRQAKRSWFVLDTTNSIHLFMKKITFILTLASFLFLTWTAFAPAQKKSNNNFGEKWESKVSPKLLAKAQRGESLDFLVVLKNQADVNAAKTYQTKAGRGNYVFHKLKQNAAATQKNILNILNTAQAPHQAFSIINAVQVKGDLQLLKTLAQLPEVGQLTTNSPVKLEKLAEKNHTNTRDPEDIEWGIKMINADVVWEKGYRGQNTIIGGQDTGYEWTHPALVNTYRGNVGSTPDHNYNWHDAIHEISLLHNDSIVLPTNNPCGLDVPFPCDDNSHGTHTMGTMVGEAEENQIGVAPGAQWIACRNMERGWGKPSTYIECFEWFMAPTDLNNENPDPTKAPHAIANSWSCPTSEGCDSTNWHIMEMVVNNLKASGVVVVVSAGNSGSQGCGSVRTPAAIFEASFSVGATAQNDSIAGFSSRGPVTVNGSGIRKPNVSAPGVAVRSSIRNDNYATFSGTSMSGPHTAGMVALMISANPNLAGHVEAIESIIEQTAVPKFDEQDCGGISSQQSPNNIYGYGRIDALAAVNAALNWKTPQDGLENVFVNIYPNPTAGRVVLEINDLMGETEFEVYNMAGQLVDFYTWNLLEYQIEEIDLSQLPAGAYIYKIRNKNLDAEKTGKILKNN